MDIKELEQQLEERRKANEKLREEVMSNPITKYVFEISEKYGEMRKFLEHLRDETNFHAHFPTENIRLINLLKEEERFEA